MSTTASEFIELCTEAGRQMNLVNPEGMAVGDSFYVHEVTCQLAYSETRASAFLSCEVGDPQPYYESEVFRQMMELQLILFQILDATFGRDPINDRLLFVVRIPLRRDLKAEDLANSVSMMARQVHEWQTQILAGKLIDYEREFEKLLGGTGAAGPVQLEGML